jgi:hypothetical protein
MLAATKARFNAELKLRHTELEWQTKSLAYMIAQTVENEKGRKSLTDMVNKMSLTEPPDTDQDHPRSVPRADTSGDTRTIEEIMEHGDVERALARNSKRKGPLPFMGPLPPAE